MKINLAIFRYAAFALEIIILALLQSTPKLMPEIFGGKAVLLISAALSLSAAERGVPVIVFAAVCGAMCDLSVSGGIGYFAIALTIVCAVISEILDTKIRSNLFTLMLLSLAAVPLVIGGYFVLFRLPAGVRDSGVLFLRHYLSRMALTYLCVIPLYLLNHFIGKRLPDKE